MFIPLPGIHEPSAIQQLPDGRFLVVEDDPILSDGLRAGLFLKGETADVVSRVFVPGARCFGTLQGEPVRGLFGGAASRLVVPGAKGSVDENDEVCATAGDGSLTCEIQNPGEAWGQDRKTHGFVLSAQGSRVY